MLYWHQKKTVESTEEFEVFKIDKSTTYKFKLQPAGPPWGQLIVACRAPIRPTERDR